MRLAESSTILDASDANPMFIGTPDHGKVLTPTVQPELLKDRYLALR